MNKLTTMGLPKGSQVLLAKWNHSDKWHCNAEGTIDGMAFKVEGGIQPTVEDAIDACYEKWAKITKAMPEFLGALPPPPPADDFQDADHMLRPDKPNFNHSQPSAVDDDIPF